MFSYRALLPAFALTCAISHAEEAPKVLAIGSPAPAFSLPGIDGKTHTLAEYSGAKVLTVIFTCNHCPDAVAAAPRTEALYQDYKDKGVALIAVNANNPIGLRPDELGYSPYNDSPQSMAGPFLTSTMAKRSPSPSPAARNRPRTCSCSMPSANSATPGEWMTRDDPRRPCRKVT